MNDTVLLSSAYLAPVEYYSKLCGYPKTRIERFDHYVKQTYRNRCVIASPGGQLSLTIPTADTGGGKTLMKDVRISDHGNWRHVHWNAFEAAYRHSPFFDYYADEFHEFYKTEYEYLIDFNRDLAKWVCRQIDIEPNVTYTECYVANPADADDFRERIHPKKESSYKPRRYWQVFSERYGFLPNLSIADLLFNMGPEAIIVLDKDKDI